ncbi:glycosyltransferase family 2 protein [Lachnospiraceae bacterium ZAX-1]
MQVNDTFWPLVTVVMPAYNAEKYIKQAIDSVLVQGIDTELIIIDDQSMDHTAEAVMPYVDGSTVIYVKNATNMGAAKSRNVAISMAKGAFIAFLDADDWWDVGKLEKQLACLNKNEGVLCCTGRELRKEDGTSMGKVIRVPQVITYKMMLKTNCIPFSSALIKTEVVREFYMSHAELHEDYLLWLQVLNKYPCAYGIDEPMLKSRLSQGGKSRNKYKSAQMHFGVYRVVGYGYVKSIYYFIHYMVNGILKYR